MDSSPPVRRVQLTRPSARPHDAPVVRWLDLDFCPCGPMTHRPDRDRPVRALRGCGEGGDVCNELYTL